MKKPPKKLVQTAPEGTVWFGGPVDRSKVSLRILGDELDPEEITELLKVSPTECCKKGDVIAGKYKRRTGCWSLESHLPDDIDVEDKVMHLLSQVTNDESTWKLLNSKYQIDLFCGLFLETDNRGIELSVETIRKLSSLGIKIGFDIYFDIG